VACFAIRSENFGMGSFDGTEQVGAGQRLSLRFSRDCGTAAVSAWRLGSRYQAGVRADQVWDAQSFDFAAERSLSIVAVWRFKMGH